MEIAEYKKKKQNEMENLLNDLIDNWEDEVVEFKEAGRDYDKERIGQYFSALSNEANLRSLQYGWLVFGVCKLPDYDLTQKDKVEVTVYGHEIDEKYTYLLHDNDNLDLVTVYLLDQVQKGNKLPKDAIAHLRKHNLVEGRAGNLYLAAPLAKSDDDKAIYIKNKGFDNKYYQDMIIGYIRQFGKANKQQIRVLLSDKLPNTMSDEQKDRKILSFLTQLRKAGVIVRDSESRQHSNWILVKEREMVNEK